MTQYSDDNILDSKAHFLCFASSTILRPKDVHGDKQIAPMASMSALAKALYEFDNKLATVLVGQFNRARMIHQETKMLPLISIRMEDGRFVSPFIVRRHTMDPVDNSLVIHSVQAIFRRVTAEALVGHITNFAIERPIDADETFDRIVGMLPRNITIHREVRDAD